MTDRISFTTSPEQYRHWRLSFEGETATLAMDVQEEAGLNEDTRLKLNSYDRNKRKRQQDTHRHSSLHLAVYCFTALISASPLSRPNAYSSDT